MESMLFYKFSATKKQSTALFIYVPHTDELIKVPFCQKKISNFSTTSIWAQEFASIKFPCCTLQN